MDQWKIWKETELEIYLICGHENLAYNLAREIEKNRFNVRNIISFDCDSSGISNIVYFKKYPETWDGDKSQQDIKRVIKYKEQIFQFLKAANEKYNVGLNFFGKYYISL